MPPWINTARRETGLIEHVCEHGVGHPAYGSADYMGLAEDYWGAHQLDDDGHIVRTNTHWFVHGCDGCCGADDWREEDLMEGLKIANELILHFQDKLKEEALFELDYIKTRADWETNRGLL